MVDGKNYFFADFSFAVCCCWFELIFSVSAHSRPGDFDVYGFPRKLKFWLHGINHPGFIKQRSGNEFPLKQEIIVGLNQSRMQGNANSRTLHEIENHIGRLLDCGLSPKAGIIVHV